MLSSSYCVVFFLLGLIFFQTFYKVKKLQKKLNQKLEQMKLKTQRLFKSIIHFLLFF